MVITTQPYLDSTKIIEMISARLADPSEQLRYESVNNEYKVKKTIQK